MYNSKNDAQEFALVPTKTSYELKIQPNFFENIPEGTNLYIFGNPWISNDRYINSLERLIETNSAYLNFMLPDIVFITEMESFKLHTRQIYRSRLIRMLKISKAVFTISKHAMREIKNFINLYKLEVSIDRLFLPTPNEFKLIQEKTIKTLQDKKYILYVSSFNQRKNHDFIINVWKELQSSELDKGIKDFFLVFAGTPQAGFEKFAKNEYQEELKSDNIIIINSPEDEQIKWLYQNCLFTIYPSLLEGWGFPIKESLYFRKLCISSITVPSAIEDRPSGVIALEPRNFFDWYNMLTNLIFNNSMRESIENSIEDKKEIFSWEKSILQLINQTKQSQIKDNVKKQ